MDFRRYSGIKYRGNPQKFATKIDTTFNPACRFGRVIAHFVALTESFPAPLRRRRYDQIWICDEAQSLTFLFLSAKRKWGTNFRGKPLLIYSFSIIGENRSELPHSAAFRISNLGIDWASTQKVIRLKAEFSGFSGFSGFLSLLDLKTTCFFCIHIKAVVV